MDDSFFLFAALIVLALTLAGPAGLLLAMGQRQRIHVLERRLALLEAASAPRPAVSGSAADHQGRPDRRPGPFRSRRNAT